ncbi:MAG: glycogen/starch synthase [Sedimentisphaerales bacterium]|nr:glycogen/starch synthase [Sedimentisphaerales bacterium]
MPIVTFYFQLHQPFRLDPDGGSFLWEEQNETVFRKVAKKCYLPATRMFIDLVKAHPKFKITLSMSGIFLEQAQMYEPDVIALLHELYEAGSKHQQVEYLEETYYHSLTALFEDPTKNEFKDQVSQHRGAMRDLFGARPQSFRNTELMYNNDIGTIVNEMGFKSILCEQRADMYLRSAGAPISPNAIFRAKGPAGWGLDLLVLPRNRDLSDDVAFRFPRQKITPKEYASSMAMVDGEAIILGYDYEHIGEHIWEDTGIFDFWRGLPAELENNPNIVLMNPTEIAQEFAKTECPLVDIHPLATSSWADIERNTFGWLGSETQHKLFREIEAMEGDAKRARGDFLKKWRHLTTSDHLYYLHEGHGPDRGVHDYFSPYGSLAKATFVLTRSIDRLDWAVESFNILQKPVETAVIIITPETGRLPSTGMGKFAQYVSGKSGGLGDVISALCKGLTERKIPAHLVTLNLPRRFQQESQISEQEWVQRRHKLNPENVHLVTSSIYDEYRSAYEGDPLRTAAEFQRQVINTYIREIRSQYDGRAIVHTHDWMAGGPIVAYAANHDIPVLHTVHNTHTGHVPIEMLQGVNIGRMWERMYMVADSGRECVDCQATAIKSATQVSYVGKTFLQEIVEDYFSDRSIIPLGVRNETKAKYKANAAIVIPNGISPDVYPENQEENKEWDKPGLARRYGPNDNILEAKKENLVKFQKQMGLKVDPEAILLYWPSRLDPLQKGVELLEDIALSFVIENHDVQIAIVGDPVGADREHVEILGRIACASQGQIAVKRFNNDLSILGYAAASDVFGASLYEPFGQIDVVGNIYGATATNRNTGGYRDKIVRLALREWGAPKDSGNGVLFKDYDSSGLWWGLTQTVVNHRYFRQHQDQWHKQARRIMEQARRNWSLESMVAGYITAYESLGANI